MRGVRCPLLIGRDQELGVLTELLDEAGDGRGGAAFVLGEPGIGKSRLLAAVADVARSRDMAVLRGRAAASAAPVPYRPLAEAFLSGLRGRDVSHLVPVPFRAALPVLVPGSSAPEDEGNPSVVLLGEAALALATACAGPRGVVLVLDDLQWADAETLELVDYLSDKLGAAPIALVASVRTDDPSPAERLAHALAARRHGVALTLRRLASADVEAVVGASLGTGAVTAGLRDAVAEASGGVPLLIEELLTSLIDTGALWRDERGWHTTERLPALVPPSFAALVRERVAALGDPARQVLAAAAVVGEHVDARLLAAVTGLHEAAAIDALREASRAQVLDEVPAGRSAQVRFRHGLGRVAVLDLVPEAERRRLAARALEALEADDDASAPRPLDLMADLALSAGDAPRAVRVLVEAAAAALARGAPSSAQRSAALAADVAPGASGRADARRVLLAACVATGDATRAGEVGRHLLDDLVRLDAEPAARAEVHLELARAALAATDTSLAERHVTAAAALAGAELPADVRARTDLVRAAVALARHEPDEAVTHARRAAVAASAAGDAVALSEAAALVGRAHRVTDVAAARSAFTDALAAAERAGDPVLIATAAHELATLDVLEAGPAEAMAEARRLAEAAGALALVAVCDLHLSIIHWLHFDLDASRTSAQRALDAASRYQLRLLVPAAAVMVVGPGALLGRQAEVAQVFQAQLQMMDREIEATERGHVLALAALAAEDRREAMAQLELAASLAPPFSDVARAPHCGVRALLLAFERDGTAAAVVERLAADPGVVGVPRALVDLATAVLAARCGDRTTAAATAAHAFARLERAPWFRAVGQRLVAEAAIDDGWGRPAAWLRDAHDFFDAAGVHAPAAACRQLLRRAGAPAPRRPVSGQHPELARLGVTPRESEVLALVADGRSNQEVADELVLSVRTVEKHVERLMVKTATANRTQLAALANRLRAAAGTT